MVFNSNCNGFAEPPPPRAPTTNLKTFFVVRLGYVRLGYLGFTNPENKKIPRKVKRLRIHWLVDAKLIKQIKSESSYFY